MAAGQLGYHVPTPAVSTVRHRRSAILRRGGVCVSGLLAVGVAVLWCLDRRSTAVGWWAAPSGPASTANMGVLVGRAGGQVVVARGEFLGPGWGRASGPVDPDAVRLIAWSLVNGDNEPASDVEHAGVTFIRAAVNPFDPAKWVVAVPDWMLVVAFSAAPVTWAVRRRPWRAAGRDVPVRPPPVSGGPESSAGSRSQPGPPGHR